MKLEVGMYVRIDGRKASSTKYQNFFMIDKIHHIDNSKSKYKYLIKEDKDGYCYAVSDEMISKASHNIIDLIEVGDYVNGCYVTNLQAKHNEGITIIPKRIGIIKCNAYFNQGNYNDCEFKWVEEKDIKTIVTKEQFSQMEYKVVE